jgi:GAF domain-containing protein
LTGIAANTERGEAQASRDLRDLPREQAALRRVAAIATAGEPPEAVFAAVTAEASALLNGVLMSIARYESGGDEQVILAHTGDHLTVGEWFPGGTANTISARMWRSGRPERVDNFALVPGAKPAFDRRGVRACVAVPVFVDAALWGSLAAASRSRPLPAATEERLTVFAEIVAATVVSAAARASVRVLADEQAALLRVAALVAQGAAEGLIFDAVAREAAGLFDEEPTTLVRYEGKRTFRVLATHKGPVSAGTRVTVPVDDAGVLDEMLRTLAPARRDRYDTIADRSFSNREFAVGSSVSVPIFVQGRLWGALGVLNEGRRLPSETEGRLAKFSDLVGSALANVTARAELKRFGEEQAALRRVAELAASGVPHAAVLRSIVVEASPRFDEAGVSVWQYAPSGPWRRIEVAETQLDRGVEPGLAVDEAALAAEVLSTGAPATVEDDDPSTDSGPGAERLLEGSAVPVRVEG